MLPARCFYGPMSETEADFAANVPRVLIAELPPTPPSSMVSKAPPYIRRDDSQFPAQRALLDPSWPTPGGSTPTFGVDVSNWEG